MNTLWTLTHMQGPFAAVIAIIVIAVTIAYCFSRGIRMTEKENQRRHELATRKWHRDMLIEHDKSDEE